jgi:hypothetical protein
MRQTAAEKETARHRVDLLILNLNGDVVESHRMQSWDVERTAGELAGAFRDTHGYSPVLRVRFPDGRDGNFLLPRSWR